MFFEPVFSKYQCGFRKGDSAQHCPLVMIEKWEKCLERNGVCGALTHLVQCHISIPPENVRKPMVSEGIEK